MNKKHTLHFLLLVLFSFSLSAQNTDVMLQGFNWESHSNTLGWYNVVKDKAADLGAAQIDLIWLPPVSDAAAPQGYLPRELYVLDSEYGTQAELQAAIADLNAAGVKAVADIVINHRVGTTNWADFTNPTWGCWSITANDEWGQNGGTPCGNYDTGENYGPARDLDHTNATVQTDLIAWMNFLKNTIGFDGWRYDYVRGYNGYYNMLYNNATSPYFSVGELWDNLDLNNTDPHRQQLIDWVDDTQGTSTVFDFTTKGILQQAVNGELWRLSNNGGAPGVIGWWPEKSVTFIDNHDTGSTQNYWPFPSDKVMQGYAYILTHPGIPSVFWDHFYDWGLHDDIEELIAIRKAQGIHSGSTLDIKTAQWNVYAAEIDGKVAMKIGSGSWSPSGSGWTLATSGQDYAVWTKSQAPVSDFTVYFKKPSNWGTPRIHHWGAQPSGALSDTNWPGVVMDYDCDDWYTFSFSGISSTNLLFHDNNNQTADLDRSSDGWYDGQWYDNNPAPCSGGSDLTVHFHPNTYSNPTIYFWNVSNGQSTTWPGVAMQNDGNGWYSYTFAGANCANFIFSNNGGNQTADLYSCTEFWYDDPAFRIAPSTDAQGPLVQDWNSFPNPVRDDLYVEWRLREASEMTIRLYDVYGRVAAELARGDYAAGRHQQSFTADLPGGYYLLQLEAGGQQWTRGIVVTKE